MSAEHRARPPEERPAVEGTKVLFCGDRAVSARMVELLQSHGGAIVGLGLNSPPFADHANDILAAAEVAPELVFYGSDVASEVALRRFSAAGPHLGICCGFASVLPKELLNTPRWGWVNVHRSYLPYNRGLDPLQWAVVEGTPVGVTLHVMTEEVDGGPVIVQRSMPVFPTDNAQRLGERADALAYELFATAWPRLLEGDLAGTPQDETIATHHSWADCKRLRHIDPNATMRVGRLLDIVRTYTADSVSAAYLDVGPLRLTVHTEVRANSVPGRPETAHGESGADGAGTSSPRLNKPQP